MTFQLSDPAEAYIAIIFAVSAADGDFNPAEFQSSHSMVDNLAAFQKHDDETIANFWIDMTRRFFDTFTSGLALNQSEADDLISAVKAVLPEDQYDTAYAVAAEVALAEGTGSREQTFLFHLQRGLNIGDEQAQAIQAHLKGQ